MRRGAELSSPPGGELDQMAGPAAWQTWKAGVRVKREHEVEAPLCRHLHFPPPGFLKGAGESEVTEVKHQAWMRFALRC